MTGKRSGNFSTGKGTQTWRKQKSLADFGISTPVVSGQVQPGTARSQLQSSGSSSRSRSDSDVGETWIIEGQVVSIKEAREAWKDEWLLTYPWIDWDSERALIFCKPCKEGGSRCTYGMKGGISIKTSAFKEHARSAQHAKYSYAYYVAKEQMQKSIAKARVRAESSLKNLFFTAYLLGKENIAFAKYPKVCALLKALDTPLPGELYQCDKAAASMVETISDVLLERTLVRVKASPFFGIMMDESTDISVTNNLVVFATFLEYGNVECAFLGSVPVIDRGAEQVTQLLIELLSKWGLSHERFVAFGSDGASVMTGYFRKSSKRRDQLKSLQETFNDAHRSLKRFIRVRWLSRAQAVVSLCNSLESVLTLLQNSRSSEDHGIG
ncbi:hypothetical protein R1sor_012536 [Riccia sorocarpa]|uniref:DUF4371 domain-containing protein n=1 Tax=Riccia sorocarpa TaxID=122646 RepID=A0ABD3I427_9MARC